MPTISAVINTRNEEKNIRYCLESVKWCDEIIIVDMESDDKTVEIAREYTDKIYSHEKVMAFDVARKFAVEKASGDWVLLVDADELIPNSLKMKLIETAFGDAIDVLNLPRKDYVMGAWIENTGFWPDYQPRFFRKGSIVFTEHVHKFMHIADCARIQYLSAEEKYAIEHFAYIDAEQFVEKLNRYTNIEAGEYFSKGIKFDKYKLIKSFIGEFLTRYIGMKGYKDGIRGLFVSLMMGMYRMVSYIKLWELYEYRDKSVTDSYNEFKDALIKESRD